MGRKKGDDIDSANMTTTEHNISLLEEQIAIAIEATALASFKDIPTHSIFRHGREEG